MKKIVLDTELHGDDLIELIHSGGSIPLKITGTSMMPLLRPGRDSVWLKACTPDALQRGRILLFRRPSGALVLHRIRKCMPDGTLKMNGDAQSWCEWIPRDAVVASAEELIIRGKRFSYRALPLRLWDILWYPTRPIRPMLFRTYSFIKSCFKKH